MRHNQGARHARGRRGNSNGGNGNGGHNGNSGHSSHNGQRRMNPRVQTFDSNGPDVRIRGNAYQVAEKYQTLARDANSAGDRVLAESYLQHAEHYQRLVNEMEVENNTANRAAQGAPGEGPQPDVDDRDEGRDDAQDEAGNAKGDLDDLDQSFLVGNRRASGNEGNNSDGENDGEGDDASPRPSAKRNRAAPLSVGSRQKAAAAPVRETEAV